MRADFAEPPRPFVCPVDGFPEADYLGSCFYDLWSFGGGAERHKCYALLYQLFAYFVAFEKASLWETEKYKLIEPAMEYLKAHIYDGDLKIEMLHKVSGISHTYFRQIFASRYGMSPRKFVLQKRLAHAKALLDSGDYDTVGEVSFSAGFNDPMYFSKVFKRVYGVSPSGSGKE